jgi:hypothetical protein
MAAHTLKSSAPVASKEEAMEKFSFAEYFGEINALADLQFMPGDMSIGHQHHRNRKS